MAQTVDPKPIDDPILQYEFSIPITEPPWRVAWSHDDAYLAITEPTKFTVRIVDVTKRELLPQPAIKGIVGEAALAWSPDGRYLAALSGGRRNAISITSTTDWTELSLRNRRIDEVCFGDDLMGGIDFEADSQSLWMPCKRQLATNPPYIVAAKLSIPQLEVVDRLELQPALPGRYSTSRHNIRLTRNKLQSLLLAVIPKLNKVSADNTARRFIRITDLGSKSPIGAEFEIIDDSGIQRTLWEAHAADDGRTVVLRWGNPEVVGASWDSAKNYRLESYDTATGRRLAQFAGSSADTGTVKDFRLGSIALLRRRPAVVGSFYDGEAGRRGLIVWDSRTGKVLQIVDLKYARGPFVSRSGLRFAVAISGSELAIYRVHD